MRPKEEYKETDNPSVHKKLRKHLLAKSKDGIKCDRCPYHKIENSERIPKKSWKRNQKGKQWDRGRRARV